MLTTYGTNLAGPIGPYTASFVPTDPLAGSQWYLAALGNLNLIWHEFIGTGIHVGIYDDGVQSTHPDLDGSYDATREVTLGGMTYSGANLPGKGHGTAVAGLIAAENDGAGAIGIAFGSSITSVNIFDPASPLYVESADLSGFFLGIAQGNHFDVINHSWGTDPDFTDNGSDPGSLNYGTLPAYAEVSAQGRAQGDLRLGTIIIQSAGNESKDANAEALNASRHTITVAAVAETGFAAYYSNHGASILLTAPSWGEATDPGVVTTDLLGADGYNYLSDPAAASDYTDSFGGTSAAAPMVTAVVALMLDANASLGWRDVQNILAASVRHTGSAIGSAQPGLNEEDVWNINGADNWNGGGMHYQTDYGYGHLDAYNAVRMAEIWSLFAAAQTSANERLETRTFDLGALVDLPDLASVPVDFLFDGDLVIEHVGITLTLQHDYFLDLRISLTSPEGSLVSLLDGTTGTDDAAIAPLTWTFGVDHLRGERSAGTWWLDLEDVLPDGVGTLGSSVTLSVFGTAIDANSVYHYTDEFGLMAALPGETGRLALADGDGGTDWINAAAVTGNSIIDLSGLTASRIAGQQLSVVFGLENVVSGDGDDELTGGAGANRLMGMRGHDRINGGSGDDSLDGGVGDDVLNGGTGNDTMLGGMGNDQLVMDSAGDTLVEFAGDGTDTVWVGASAAVEIAANVEIGRLFGQGWCATGSNGAEQLVANAALASSLDGGGGDDVLWGSNLNNSLSGGAGDDIIRGQAGGGTWAGGLGNDQFVVGNLATTLVEAVGQGSDTAWVTVSDYVVGTNIETIRLGGSAALVTGGATGTQIVGNPNSASELRGGSGDDVLWGNALADTLMGGAGDDIMRGQGGADRMAGGLGNDQFVVLDAGVVIVENTGEGYDTAWIGLAANTSFILAAQVERGNLSGAANRLTGNGLDNVLVGDAVASRLDGAAGHDIIFGSAFADTLTGGDGNDTFYCYGGADTLVYAGPGWGVDQVAGFSQAAGAKLDFRGSGIGFGQISLTFAGGNTQLTVGADIILVFGAVLAANDFLFV